MKIQAKRQSFWSTFKNAYLRSANLKKFWTNLDKTNLTKELIEICDLYIDSDSYALLSKYWRHLTMNHLTLMTHKKKRDYEQLIDLEYFTSIHFDEFMIKDAMGKINHKMLDLNINLFKKHDNFSSVQSLNHNLILLMLYENIKSKEIFKYFKELRSTEGKDYVSKPSLTIDGLQVNQDDINSLFEYEQIEKLLNKLQKKNRSFLEIGAGSGRTAKTIISIKNNVKYVIADIPPAINTSLNNLRNLFPDKRICKAFDLNSKEALKSALHQNDILFIFPHQIGLFQDKTFDMTIAIDCLHEMDKKTIKNYMSAFERISNLLYIKVWEYSGLPYSFYQYHSVHKDEDYSIKDSWKEHLREKCLFPSNYFQLGYEF